jgi:PAS domain S-box-containing protein
MYPVPENEAERLQVLHSFANLDETPEQEFDDAAALAAEVCRTPMALVSIVDAERQWFKARIGIEQSEMPRCYSFCTHALLGCRELVVPDAHADARFADNPFVRHSPHIRFYAGVPLTTREGTTLGVLCVLDREPRELAHGQLDALHALARQVMAQLELKRGAAQLARGELAHADSEGTRQQLSRLLVEQSGDGIVVVDEQGVLQVFNPEAQRQHGVLPEAIACTRWAQVLGFSTLSGEPLRADDAPLARALAGEQVRGTEWAVRRPDGSVRLLSGNAAPLHHADGRLAGAVLISRDITEQRRTEQALQEAVRARDAFLSIASHELRTPLSALSLQASGLLRALRLPAHVRPPEARLAHNAERLKRQVDRLEALVDGLLDVSRLSRGTLRH